MDLYRYFDKSGDLLYVGISVSAVARMAQHKATADWFEQAARIEIEKAGSLEEALKKERDAIKAECPKFNIRSSSLKKVGPVTQRPTLKQIRTVKSGPIQFGNGLIMRKTGRDCGRWIFRFSHNGRRRDMGLGSFPEVNIKSAEMRRDKWRSLLAMGIDPIEARKSGKTFKLSDDRR